MNPHPCLPYPCLPYACLPSTVPLPTPPARRQPRAAAPIAAFATVLLGLAGLTLTGCAQWQTSAAAVQRRVHEIGCTSECQKAKDRCDDNARYQYQQCEAGYQTAQRDFRWCNSSGADECGYPWWSCSENLYGYCTNRFNECALDCRRGSASRGYESAARY